MHKLVLKNITVEDHRRRIVDDVSLETEGDLLVIGESGAGKTTLLKAMAGLLDDEGQVNLDERDISSLPSHARHMSMIFQKAALLKRQLRFCISSPCLSAIRQSSAAGKHSVWIWPGQS